MRPGRDRRRKGRIDVTSAGAARGVELHGVYPVTPLGGDVDQRYFRGLPALSLTSGRRPSGRRLFYFSCLRNEAHTENAARKATPVIGRNDKGR